MNFYSASYSHVLMRGRTAEPVRFGEKDAAETARKQLETFLKGKKVPFKRVEKFGPFGMGALIPGETPKTPSEPPKANLAVMVANMNDARRVLEALKSSKDVSNIKGEPLTVVEIKAAGALEYAMEKKGLTPVVSRYMDFITLSTLGNRDGEIEAAIQNLAGLKKLPQGDSFYPLYSYQGQKVLVGYNAPFAEMNYKGYNTSISVF